MANGAVWKITRPVEDDITLDLPLHSTLLKVGDTEGLGLQLDFWFLVKDTETPSTESRKLCVVGTGHPIDSQQWNGGDYWDSVVTAGGAIVWHIFKVGKG